MPTAKWFPKLNRSTDVGKAARIVLEARARGVTDFLDRIRTRPGEDSEHVHQLRVATRRLAAALSVFRGCLDPVAYRRLRRSAREIRRAAGSLRDLHVQQAMLKQRFDALGSNDSTMMTRWDRQLISETNRLERSLTRTAHRWADRFARSASEALATLRRRQSLAADCSGELAGVAHKVLRKRLKKLRSAGRADLKNLDNLHQLRIAAKRLRYAMEVFSGCFPREFRRHWYAQVEQIQEDLGEINDLRNLKSTVERLQARRGSPRRVRRPAEATAVRDLMHAISRELNERHAEFLERWTARKSAAFLRRFKQLLKRRLGRSAAS